MNRIRRDAGAVIASLPASAVPESLPMLSMLCKKADRDHSGLLRPHELEDAVRRSGLAIPGNQVRSLIKSLGASDVSSLIEYRQVLSQLYEHAVHEAPEKAAALPKPDWHVSRQRRLKTDVAQTLGQQPKATENACAEVETIQERLEASRPIYGKKIDGFPRPAGDGEAKGGIYWFADTHLETSGPPPPQNAAIDDSLGGGSVEDQKEGQKALWFATAGADNRSLKEMADWRPTKDASIMNDLQKVRQAERRRMDGNGVVTDGAPPSGQHHAGVVVGSESDQSSKPAGPTM